RDAISKGDWERAGDYLDTRYLPEPAASMEPGKLARQLVYVWNQQNLVDLSRLSDHPEGNLDDGLPSYRDQIGHVRLPGEEIEVFLQRIPGPDGERVWRISNATVAEIPALWAELGYHPLAIRIGEFLPPFHFLGMENWQLVGALAAFGVSWPVAALAAGLLAFGTRRLLREAGRPLARFFRVPLRFFLFLVIARALIINHLGLSMAARIYVESAGVDFVAWGILVLGLITLLRDYQVRRMELQGRSQFVPLMRPFALMVKIIVVIVLALFWAHEAGYNMSTVLAGLGVGSLAVALAAQKTLENVIGALMLYTARPVNPGDLCRFGTVVGWVEEIGLRSTVIRTLDRSLMVIPNAMFSALEIENISARDRIRFHRQLYVLAGNADQFRVLLTALRRLFLAHPRLQQDSVSVRLERLEGAAAVVRIDARVETRDYQDFLAVAEDLNLRLLELVAEADLALTAPSQYLTVDRHREGPAASRERAADELARWRAEDRWPFPDLPDGEKEQLRGTLDYPTRGPG
ncbi:MAG TPA: mechanosensitive ion channel domain-containing protein, partial [Pseudohaliea sp.]|nr:mechanosensitive ion channel domain-containing protein [Pseudohaliea sp.]